MAWDYAELSKMAKANGGPEKLVDLLINSGKRKIFGNYLFVGCAKSKKRIVAFPANSRFRNPDYFGD